MNATPSQDRSGHSDLQSNKAVGRRAESGAVGRWAAQGKESSAWGTLAIVGELNSAETMVCPYYSLTYK